MVPDIENLTINDVFGQMVRNYPEKEILVLGEKRHTYKQFSEKVDSLAANLQQLGVKKGDKIGIILPACVENLYAFFAILQIGAAFVPINPDLRALELQHILNDSNAIGVIVSGENRGIDHLTELESIRKNLPNLELIIVWGSRNRNDYIQIDDLLKVAPRYISATQVSPNDIASIIYTSGTTGSPKGTLHSHRSRLRRIKAFEDIFPPEQRDSRLSPFSLFNSAGVDISFQSILYGQKLVLMERFNPTETLKAIEMEKVSVLECAPTMLMQMLNVKNFALYDLSTLRAVGTAGSMASPEMVRAVKEKFRCNYINIYAMTEAGIVSRLVPDDPLEIQLSTVGRPIRGVDIKIVNGRTYELPNNQIGEIAVRTPGLMQGYYNNPEQTAEVMDEEGFYYTGDIGYKDELGYLRILDRKKDVIIRGAQNIYPSEVEKYLHSHPKIHLSAVIGIPHQVIGEKTRAYVQLVEGEQMTDIEVVEYCRGIIANYKIPDEVQFVNSLPLNKMGKVQKRILREAALKGDGVNG